MSNKVTPEIIETYKNMISVKDTEFPYLKDVNLKHSDMPLGIFELHPGGMWTYLPDDMGGACTDYTLLGIGAWLFELNYKHE